MVFRRGASLWIAHLTGGGEREIAVTPGSIPFEEIVWSADGRRIVFGMRNHEGTVVTIEALELQTGRRTVLLSDRRIGAFTWVPDGRIVFARTEDPPNQSDSNLWQVAVNPQTAELRGAPVRLTNWSGFYLGFLTSGANGRRLFAVGNRWRSNIYLADLTGAQAPRRLTLEWLNWATAWTPDGSAVLFNSERNGNRDIFLQALNDSRPKPVVTGPDHSTDARLSPDGRWILYFNWPDDNGVPRARHGRLMRMPVNGGAAEPVLDVKTFPNWEVRHPRLHCPAAEGSPCVLSEAAGGEAVFTAVDPLRGRMDEVYRMPLGGPDAWHLSPDGAWIALTNSATARVRLVSLKGEAPRQFDLKGWANLQSLHWSHDGRALFGNIISSFGDPLLRISLDGDAKLLYRGSKYVQSPVASPDGRWLAFTDRIADANAWVIERAP